MAGDFASGLGDELGPKFVHFLVDFHPDWLLSRGLPSSARKQDQLNAADIDSVLDRLEPANQLLRELQLFTGVKIGHSEYQGCQIVHCAPFKSTHERPRMVHISIYMHVYHHDGNISPHCTYLTILVPVDDILPINLQDYALSVPPPSHYCGRRSRLSPSIDECWYGRVALLFKIHVRTDSGALMPCTCAMMETPWDYSVTTALVKPSLGGHWQARPRLEPRCSTCPTPFTRVDCASLQPHGQLAPGARWRNWNYT